MKIRGRGGILALNNVNKSLKLKIKLNTIKFYFEKSKFTVCYVHWY